MNASHLVRGVAVLVLFSTATTLFGFGPDRSGTRGITIIQTFDPQVTPNMGEVLPAFGEVRVIMNVDAKGQLVDWLPVSYTHQRYLDAAVEALKEWKYRPAAIHGEPTGCRQQLVFNFQTRGQIVSFIGLDAANALFAKVVPSSMVRRVYPANALDEAPTPVKVVQPRWVPSMETSAPGTGVKVDFYIDDRGRPRMPTVSPYTDPSIAEAVVDAISQWEFSVPTRDGRPVIVRATQWFALGNEPKKRSRAQALGSSGFQSVTPRTPSADTEEKAAEIAVEGQAFPGRFLCKDSIRNVSRRSDGREVPRIASLLRETRYESPVPSAKKSTRD